MKRLRIVSGSLVLVGISVFALGVFTLLRVALNVSHVPNIVTYYAECKQDELSEVAFFCAASVYHGYCSKEFPQWFDALSNTNKVGAATRRRAIERFVDEHRQDIFSQVSGERRRFFTLIGTLADPNIPPDEKEWLAEKYELFPMRLRRDCYFRRRYATCVFFAPDAPREMVHEYLEKRSSYSIEDGIEDGLRQMDLVDAEFIIQCHKIIIQDWRKHREEYLKDAR